MPTFKKVAVRAIPRKDKPTMYIGHNSDGEFFLQSNDTSLLAKLAQASETKTLIDIDSSSFTKPQLGSMFVNNIDMTFSSASSVPPTLK